jgi:UDP-3-O-[3-hydroxymyristoyl] glucosamine N-acyltransferase
MTPTLQMTVREIATLIGAGVEGDDGVIIRRVGKIEEAGGECVSFLANPRYARFLDTTLAAAVIVGKDAVMPDRTDHRPVVLRVADPYGAFVKVMSALTPVVPQLPPGIHPRAEIDPTAVLGTDVRVGPFVVIGEGCRIGNGTMILAGCVIGRGVTIGENCLIYANVTIREGCVLGSRVIVHSGTVIGSDGFGFAPRADGTYDKIPQLGIVALDDDVEIGANCALDRATVGETRIEKGTKLDNLIQVAHNVRIGEATVAAAQTGFAGSAKIGKRNMIAGQAAFVGHIEIADDCKFGGQAGVHKSITKPGGTYMGTPAVPFRDASKIFAGWSQLPDALHTIMDLKKEIAALRKEIDDLRSGKS